MANNGGADDPAIVGTVGRRTIAPKVVVGYAVDTKARLLLVEARGPLDVETITVAIKYGQLKHVVGQLMTQEGEGELTGKLAVTEIRLPEGKPS